jgi:glycosyltransferase involved in cell wall biosynthesis
MRILIATSHRTIVGGVETYLHDLLPALASRGHQLSLVYEVSGRPGEQAVDEQVLGVPAWCLDEPRALHGAAAWAPDVCYLQGLAFPESEAALAERFRVVLFAHNYHGTCISGTKRHALPSGRPCSRPLGPACLGLYYPCRCGGLNPQTLVRLYRQQRRRLDLLRRYEAILVGSRHMHQEYLRHGIPEQRVHLTPLFPPGSTRDALPPSERPFTDRVLLVGRLTEVKGGRHLVRAMAAASRILGRSLRLVVTGDGPERAAMEQLAVGLGVPAEFHGWVRASRRDELMRDTDLLAVPSLWPEPFGLVGLEAACVGLPAVAFAVGGIPDWLHVGVSGELAPGDAPTVPGLAIAIVRALADPRHHAGLRRGAWTVAGSFTRERHVEILETVLDRVGTHHAQGTRTPCGAALAVEPPAHLEATAHGGPLPVLHDRA